MATTTLEDYQTLELVRSLESSNTLLEREALGHTIYTHALPGVSSDPSHGPVQRIGNALKYLRSLNPCGFTLADIQLVDPTANRSTVRATVNKLLISGSLEIIYKGGKGRGAVALYKFV